MAEQGTIKGRIVAATAKPYTIAPKGGDPGRTGTAYAIFVVPDFREEPVKIKVRAADLALWNEADDAGPDTDAACVYTLRGTNGGGLERTLQSLTIISE